MAGLLLLDGGCLGAVGTRKKVIFPRWFNSVFATTNRHVLASRGMIRLCRLHILYAMCVPLTFGGHQRLVLGSTRPKIDQIDVGNNGFLSARIVAFLSVAGRLARWGELLEAPAS